MRRQGLKSFAVLCAALVGLTLGDAVAQSADGAGSTSARQSIFKSQSQLLDGRLSSQYRGSGRLRPGDKPAIQTALPRYSGSYRGTYLETARAAARKHAVPADLFLRLVQQESAWKPTARSHKGAIGLAQLMPATARKLRVDPHDPRQNLEGGARYLRMMYDKFGTWRLALAAYNAGPGAVAKHGGVPPYRETQNYVKRILGN